MMHDTMTLSLEGALAGTTPQRARIEIDCTTGLMASIGSPTGTADLVLDDSHLILPGLIDFHVHAREDASGRDTYKEDFQTAARAAIRGGITAMVDMPNNPVAPIDAASYEKKRELASKAPVEIFLYAGIGPRSFPLPYPVPYKVYMGPSVGDLFFESEGQLRDALSRYAGQWITFHAEKPEILRACKDRTHHHERRPPEAEIEAVELALRLAREIGFTAHIAHLSTRGGLEAIRAARRAGQSASCEVTQHHLSMDLGSLKTFPKPGFLQCNPPLRSATDRLALLDAFRAGEIDFLASDHAPHSLEENERGISGMPHLDTSGAFLFWLRDQGVNWETILDAACVRPGRTLARFFPGKRGVIEAGAVGSLTILNTRRPATIDRNRLATRSGWSPFEGLTFAGVVAYTVVRGVLHRAE